MFLALRVSLAWFLRSLFCLVFSVFEKEILWKPGIQGVGRFETTTKRWIAAG
jgi:hypothetical protein